MSEIRGFSIKTSTSQKNKEMRCKVIKQIYLMLLLLNPFLSTNAGFDTYKHALNILEQQNNRKFA